MRAYSAYQLNDLLTTIFNKEDSCPRRQLPHLEVGRSSSFG